MRDDAFRQLKITVERAVRPVVASTARKHRMRQELLAHLTAIYDEELKRPGDSAAALDAARARFGDPAQLSTELAGTVSRPARVLARWQQLFAMRPGESPVHYSFRLAIYTFAAQLVSMVLFLPFARAVDTVLLLRVILVTTGITAALAIVLLLLGFEIARALHGNSDQRSWPKAALLSFASLAFLPALAWFAYVGAGGGLAGGMAHMRYGLLYAPVTPAVLLLISRQIADELEDLEEWATLELEA